MDHFWALIKTLGVVIAWIVGMIAVFFFAAFGIPFLGDFFWNNGKLIFTCFFSLMLAGMVVIQYFDFLKAERKKREDKISH